MVELAEDDGHLDVVDGHGVLRIGALDGLEAGEGAFVVEIVEVVEGLADLGGEVDGVGVGGGIEGLRAGGQLKEEDEEKEANCANTGFYCRSPGVARCILKEPPVAESHILGFDVVVAGLDLHHRKLYPWAPRITAACAPAGLKRSL